MQATTDGARWSRKPSHDDHPVDEIAVFINVAEPEINVRRDGPVSFELIGVSSTAPLGIGEVNEQKQHRLQQLEYSVLCEEERRQMSLSGIDRLLVRHGPSSLIATSRARDQALLRSAQRGPAPRGTLGSTTELPVATRCHYICRVLRDRVPDAQVVIHSAARIDEHDLVRSGGTAAVLEQLDNDDLSRTVKDLSWQRTPSPNQ